MYVKPGNPDLCGAVPDGVPLYDASNQALIPPLPSCSTTGTAQHGSGKNVGAIVGEQAVGLALESTNRCFSGRAAARYLFPC